MLLVDFQGEYVANASQTFELREIIWAPENVT